MITPPEYVQALEPYVPGKPIEELQRELGVQEAIKLASNENPLGPSPMAQKAIQGILSGLNRYPDGNGFYLKRALSERIGVGEEEIILGNGSNELLDIAVRTFMTRGDEAVMGIPSFVVYPLSVQSIGGKPVQVPLSGWRHDLKRMAGAITGKTKILFIANPNNPTGTINYADEFEELIEMIPDDLLLIVDEAYTEYVEDRRYPDTMKYLERGNLLILRTFSKIYGLAGLRIGYGISSREIVMEMNKVRAPFNTSTVAQTAALAALEDEDHLKRSVEMNRQGKAYLYREFERLGISFLPTEANFIYITFREKVALEIYNRLLKRGVIVRPMGPDAIRVTIGLPGENRQLVEAMEEVIS
jgi:histidinol-phosphate aminotransferase